MKRRSFLTTALWVPVAALGGLAALLQACSDDDDVVSGSTPNCNGESATTLDLHFHGTCISQAQLNARAAITIALELGSGHTHSLDLTAGQVGDIADGTTVVATSTSNSGHTHQVTFN